MCAEPRTMLCRRMRLAERHLQPPREPLEGPIVRPCTARKLMNLDNTGLANAPPPSPHNAISHATITIPTGDTPGPACEAQQCSPRGRKSTKCPKTPLMIVNLNIPPGTETLAPKSASRAERHKLPPFCVQYRNLARFCSAPASSGVPTPGTPGTPHILAGPGGVGATIPQIFIQSFELQDRRAVDGPAGAAGAPEGEPGSQQYNIITENDEDTFATLLLDNISNISLEMIQRHQQKLLGTTGTSSLTDGGQQVTGASAASGATCFQHAEGCSSMERTDSKTSTDLRMDSTEERFGAGPPEAEGRRAEVSAGHRRTAGASQETADEQLSDIPPGYRSLCYRTPSPKTRQIIRVDIVTSREKY